MDNPKHPLPSRPDQTVILVVDDDATICHLARTVLQKEGYFILAAADGEEALLLSRSFPGTIHLLLSDVKMPRMNGLQLKEGLLAERPATKVLLMSAYTDLAIEGTAFLQKPFRPEMLGNRVEHILQTGGSTGEGGG